MLARACLQNSCWGSQQELEFSKPDLQPMFLTATSNPEDIPNDNRAQLPTLDPTSILSKVPSTGYVQKSFVCPSTVDVFEEDVISYTEYLHNNVNEELTHQRKALDTINCSQLDQKDATAQTGDIGTSRAHVMTTQMSDSIPKPPELLSWRPMAL